jgi:hypothetical protein
MRQRITNLSCSVVSTALARSTWRGPTRRLRSRVALSIWPAQPARSRSDRAHQGNRLPPARRRGRDQVPTSAPRPARWGLRVHRDRAGPHGYEPTAVATGGRNTDRSQAPHPAHPDPRRRTSRPHTMCRQATPPPNGAGGSSDPQRGGRSIHAHNVNARGPRQNYRISARSKARHCGNTGCRGTIRSPCGRSRAIHRQLPWSAPEKQSRYCPRGHR